MIDTKEAYARNTDPETSHQAAHAVKEKLKGLEGAVVVAIRAMGEATQMEVANWMEEKRPELVGNRQAIQTVSPRFAPLERKGWIKKTGQRRDNRNIYTLTEKSKQG